MSQTDKSSRPDLNAKRVAKAAETRSRLLDAAAVQLRKGGGTALSLDAVAAAAGVTRLTVYNQFGSRRGLLEAVFDRLAARGGLAGVAKAMAIAQPRDALAELLQAFCNFWGSDECFAGLYAAADNELTESLAARNARRRDALTVLVRRYGGGDKTTQNDTVDVLFALTSFPMFQALQTGRREADAICALLRPLCDQALTRLRPAVADQASPRPPMA